MVAAARGEKLRATATVTPPQGVGGAKMPPGRQSWMFTKEQLESTPSLQDGMSLQQERAVRRSTCKFIEQVGGQIRPPCGRIPMSTAKVFFHRVCMSQSVMEGRQNAKLLGVACLFLACKSEGEGRSVREFIWSMNQILCEVGANGVATYPFGTFAGDASQPVDRYGRSRHPWMVEEETSAFQKVKENLLKAEILILQALDFDFTVRHPIAHIKDVIRILDQCRKKTEDKTDFEEKRRLVQGDGSVLSELGTSIYSVAVSVADESTSCTTLALEYDASIIAAGCVFTAITWVARNNPYLLIKVAKWTKQYALHLSAKFKDDEHLLSVAQGLTKQPINDVKEQMFDFYDLAEYETQQQAAGIPQQAAGMASTHAQESAAAAAASALKQPQPLQAPVHAPNGGGVNGSHTSGHTSSAPAGATPAPDRGAQDFTDLEAGKVVHVKGSGTQPHALKYNRETNVYSCTCAVWRHVPVRGPDKTCKHLWAVRGKDRETGRVGEDGIAKMESAEADLRSQQRPQHPGDGAHEHDAKRQRTGH